MLGNQGTFYLTLPSNGYDTIYRDNNPGRFKAKLLKTISLPGREWEVALSSISFPSTLSSNVRNDYRRLVDLDFMRGLNLSMNGVKDHHGNFISDKEYWIQGNKMKYEMGRKEEGLSASRDGVDFWNRMIALLTYRLHSKLPIKASGIISNDKTLLSEKKHYKWPEFSWENVGGTYRLKIDNGGIDGAYRSGRENAFYLNLEIAKAFNLIMPRQDGKYDSYYQGYELTSHVTAEHFRDPISQTLGWLDGTKLWEIIDAKEAGFKPEGPSSSSKFVKFESSVHWYFYELGNAYYSPMYQKRSLYVYTDLVQTQFMGRSETDLLREVEYNGSMNGNVIKNSYEPQNLQFIPVRKNMFDTVEIGISEVDGTQTEFVGNKNENTVVTLCFRKRAYK